MEKEYLKWIDSLINQEKAYHQQKETRAWIAVAFYWTAIIALISAAPETLLKHTIFLSPVIVLSGLFVMLFLWGQFGARWAAHDLIVALMRVKWMMLANPNWLEEQNIELPPIDKPIKKKPVSLPDSPEYPKFIGDEIEKCGTRWEARDHPLRSRQYARWRTELASYLLVILGAIVAIFSVLNPS